MKPGIDISNHQGVIDWDALAHMEDETMRPLFAFIKASEGSGFQDEYYHYNWVQAGEFGLVRGAYHFGHPENEQPEIEAEWFLRYVAPTLRVGDVVALDVETPGPNPGRWAVQWLSYVHARLGFRPLVYTSPAYAEKYLDGIYLLHRYGLWLAAWGSTMPAPVPPWEVLAVWQSDPSFTLPGISVPVDFDWFNGDDIDRLRLYGLREPVTNRFA